MQLRTGFKYKKMKPDQFYNLQLFHDKFAHCRIRLNNNKETMWNKMVKKFLLIAGGWTSWPLKVPSIPNHCMILWFYKTLREMIQISLFLPFSSFLVFLSEHNDYEKPTQSVIILHQMIQYSKVNILWILYYLVWFCIYFTCNDKKFS